MRCPVSGRLPDRTNLVTIRHSSGGRNRYAIEIPKDRQAYRDRRNGHVRGCVGGAAAPYLLAVAGGADLELKLPWLMQTHSSFFTGAAIDRDLLGRVAAERKG